MYIGRLAPSPTGLLHLGHARTFWIAQQRAHAANGELWLRNEDLDFQRVRPEFVSAMHEDLHWLGLTWVGEVTQSRRLPLYRDALQQLIARGYAYPCTCSRKDLTQALAAPHEDTSHSHEHDPNDEPIYNGRCRPPHDPWNLNTSRIDPAHEFSATTNYRFRVPDGEMIRFTDNNAGEQSFIAGITPASDFGDFLIWRKPLTHDPHDHGLPSYQLACVVDDSAMRITEVVRGRDLLKSTARQILLQRALGLATPTYFHCDLMRDEQGIRLAKRHDALALRTLRERGLTPEQVRAMLAA